MPRSLAKETTQYKKMGRLAFREEGENWVAYYALPNTLEGAIFLGSVKMAFVTRDAKRKQAFMRFMREAVGDIIEDATGHRPVWPEGAKPAPEHERTKRS